MTNSEPILEHDEGQSDDEYVRSNIKKGLFVLLLLFVSLVVVGFYFNERLEELSHWFLKNTNIWGIVTFVFFNDFIISPIPPDVILVLATKGASYSSNLEMSLAFGVASTLGGCVGWAIGRYVLKPTWFGESFKGFIYNNHRRINKYGKLMVALGALTPLPYSMTCWAAGFLKMDFKDFVFVASLRIIRFLLYFKIIMASEQLSTWLSTLFGA
ncbi:hypothetical protein GW915_03105 [bacterium]|nr:hypothetical protein [bacterium]